MPFIDPRAVQPRRARTPRRRSGARGGRDADRARPARRSGAARDRRRQPRAADDRREARARARRLLRSDVPAAPFRLERPPRAALGPLQGDRRAAAGALRPRPRSRRDDTTCSPTARRSATGCSRSCARWSARSRRPQAAAAGRRDVDPEARARLAALGYVGSFVATRAQPARRAAPTRRTRSRCSTLMNAARETGKTGDEALHEVVALLQRGRRRGSAGHRRVVHARQRVFARRAGAPRRSSTSSSALALKPDYDLAVINMANAYRALGRRRSGDGRLRALSGDRSEERLRALPDGRDLARSRRPAPAPRSSSARRWRSTRRSRRRATRSASSRSSAATRRRRARDPRALAPKPDVRLAHFNLALLAEQQRDVRPPNASTSRS